jgi:hypothetical protein
MCTLLNPTQHHLSLHQPSSSSLHLCLFILLPLRLNLRHRLPLLLPLQLIGPSNRNVLGLVVRKEVLQALLDDVTRHEVESHDARNHNLEVAGKRNELELLVKLRNEFGGAREGDTGDRYESPVHALVLTDRLAEGSALVVDGKSRDLLDELQEVDCRVEQRRLKVLLQIRVGVLGFNALDVLADVDEGDDVDGELSEYGADDVRVENVVLGTFFRKCLHRLCARDGEETYRKW